jgi:amidase
VSTFITRFERGTGSGLAVAVKDLIDMVATPTTAGCRAVADRATPAAADAACLAGIRTAESAGAAWIVGKANLHELAAGTTGVNPWFGTPRNPVDATRVPGGSSSGSAVAVATGEADVAVGTDTAGSVRIPSACCATAGLKTSWGRIPLDGVWPLAPSLDTVGPMARDMAGVIAGMQLLEPGFSVAPSPPERVGRVRIDADPAIDAAVDDALARAELEVRDVAVPGWASATRTCGFLTMAEAWQLHHELLECAGDGVGRDIRETLLRHGPDAAGRLDELRASQARWRRAFAALFGDVQVLALPTLVAFAPRLAEHLDSGSTMILATAPVSLAGAPALALPLRSARPLPASLQLVGPPGSEERLVALGRRIEAAAA